MGKFDIKSQTLNAVKRFVTDELGEKEFRAEQIFQWLHKKGVTSFDEMTNLSQEFRQKLEEHAFIHVLAPIARREAKDGTVKYLFKLADGETVESVYLPYETGRESICISSQVGCGMGCTFCATGLGGMVRNLKPGEIVDQVYAVERDLKAEISNVVLMGMGEPLANYEAVMQAIKLLNHPKGLNIGVRRITLSTCGLIPGIKQLAEEDLQIVLAISLHAPNDALRNELMPINERYPVKDLIQACHEYIDKTGRRVTFEYALMEGINVEEEHARQLGRLLKGMICHVNLIPVNPVKETGIGRPERAQVIKFQQILQGMGIETTVREERGVDIEAACGQLRSRAKGVKT